MMEREAFLARLRGAVGRPPGPVARRPDVACRRIAPDLGSAARLAFFIEQARAVGLEVVDARRGDWRVVVQGVLDGAGCRRVCRAADGDVPEDVLSWDAAVTGVAAAIAETGSLVLHSGRGRHRGESVYPPLHIAVVRVGQIVSDMVDYLSLPVAGVSSRVLITGPSKTADIEGILITGVHGPGRVVVVVRD